MLVCLIWLIQLLHYPFFKFIDVSQSSKAFEFHQRSISFIVIPLMLIELFTGFFLTLYFWNSFAKLLSINLGVILLIWIQTFTVMVPLHMKLMTKYDLNTVNSLIKQNWFRTILWTLKGIFWIFLINHIIPYSF
tara:strand:- start:327 stop:728 length:402 start_codon:yes stop_codon:yes gene_type:complete